MTIITSLIKSSKPVKYYRELISVSAIKPFIDGQITLDWDINKENTSELIASKQLEVSELEGARPIMILVHGLTGGSRDRYARQMILQCQKYNINFRSVVFINRGCGGTDVISPQIYCGAYTDDLRQAVEYINKRYPNAPLYATGYSLGANVLLKYVGEEGANCLLKGVVSIGNPYDMYYGSKILHEDWINSILYVPALTKSLIWLMERFRYIFKDTDKFSILEKYNNTSALKTLKDFDHNITAPLFGFANANHYYREASSCRYVINIQIPALLISALDDPLSSFRCIPYDEAFENKNVIIATTNAGGHSMDHHMGFFELRSWSSITACEFFCAVNSTPKIEESPKVVENRLFHQLSRYMSSKSKNEVDAEDIRKMIAAETEIAKKIDILEEKYANYSANDMGALNKILEQHDQEHKQRCQKSQEQLDQLVLLTSQLNNILENQN